MNYREQLQRLKRSHQRLAQIDHGRQHDVVCENYKDEVYSFFLNCHHLKDWLVNDSDFPVSKKDVENFIDENRELRLCADICNAHKHLKLKYPRSNDNPHLSGRDISLNLGGAGASIAIKFKIDTESGSLDAFDLATKCLELWREFIINRGGAA